MSNYILSAEQIAAIASILVALGSFFSRVIERLRRVNYRKERIRQVWNNISKARGLMSDPEKIVTHRDLIMANIRRLEGQPFMFRDLVNESASPENHLSPETIKKWREAGENCI